MSLRSPLLRALSLAWLALALMAGAARAEPVGAARAARRGLEHAPDSFRGWIESLPEDQQRAALRRLGDMPTQRRNRLFQRWEALEEGERRAFQQRMLERLERGPHQRPRLEGLSPESREQLAPLVRRWRDMGPGERRRMRERLERFRTLSPEAQQALIDKKFEAKSPEERERILESLREASKALPRRPLLDAEPEPIEPAPEP
jgi:hypothetical protein